jgi:ribosomal biogenesis protein LAS1
MTAGYVIWDDPLQKLCIKRIPFYKSIVMTLMTELGSPTQTEPEADAEKEAIFHWLEHLLISTQWTRERKSYFVIEDIRPEIMELCLLYPTLWSQRLAKVLLKNGDEEFRRDWTDMHNASASTNNLLDSSTRQNETGSKDTEMIDIDESKGNTILSYSDTPSSIGGWRLWDGPWTPRPIGI